MKKIEKQSKKRGVGTIMILIIISGIFPLLLFAAVDVPYYLQYHRKVKSIVNTVASSSVTRIDDKALAEGAIVLKYNETRTTVFKMFEKWLALEPYTYQIAGQPDYVMGMKRIVKKNETGKMSYDSMLDKDPLIVELKKGTPVLSDEKILKSTRIEFFIHEGIDQYTYTFSDGNTVTVSTPTVGVYIRSKSPGVLFKIPVTVSKIGLAEAFFDPTANY